MANEPSSKNPVINTVLQDPGHDSEELKHDAPHSHEEEVAHAWHHFHENWKFFLCFFSIVLLTVITWSINFGPTWNKVFVFVTAAMRSGLIAYFMLTLFKPFSLIRQTFIFSAIFLCGMIFLSWWDSELVDRNGHGLGNPIWNTKNPASMQP